MSSTRLTGKQRAFAIHYVATLNGTEAARRAGYKGSDTVLAGVAYENRRKPHIAALIDKLFNEQIMSRNEILARLTEQAAGDLRELTDEDGRPDWMRARQLGKTHLVKKIRRKETQRDGETTVYTEIELHDPQRAIDMLGKYHELFTNKLRVDDWRSDAIRDIRDGKISYEALANAFDDSLAAELFRSAGIPIPARQSAAVEPGDQSV